MTSLHPTASTDQDASTQQRSDAALPRELRVVLNSPQKAELLCLIEAGKATSDELSEALTTPIQRNSVNLHLNALCELGWIRIDAIQQHRGSFVRRWNLANPGFSWTAFFAHLLSAAPAPMDPVTEDAA